MSNRPIERPGVPMTTATKAGKQAITKKRKTIKKKQMLEVSRTKPRRRSPLRRQLASEIDK
jgi:hypothetical protein